MSDEKSRGVSETKRMGGLHHSGHLQDGTTSAGAVKRDIRSIRNDAEADAVGVDRFRTAMSNKLAEKRADGRGGWNHEPYTVQPDRGDCVWHGGCSIAKLRKMLREHFENGSGDMVDIANFAMMIWNRENPDG